MLKFLENFHHYKENVLTNFSLAITKFNLRSNRLKYSLSLIFILLIAGFFHFFRLNLIEFGGEDEAQVMNKIVRLLHWQTDIRNLGALLTASHPPIRYLVSLPFVAVFGATEFWLRFPHAFSGLLCVYWVFRIGKLIFGSMAGLLGALLMSVSAMSAVYRSANGIGIFTLFVLIAFENLLLFDKANTHSIQINKLYYVAIFLGLAALTFLEGILFILPAFLLAIRKRLSYKDLIKPISIYLLFISVYFLGWYIMPLVAVYLGLIPTVGAENANHLWFRLSQLGTFNGINLLHSLIATNSLVVVLGFGLVFLLAWSHIWSYGKVMILYFLPHVIVWLFVFKNPCGHGAYITPTLNILAAGGIIYLWHTPTRKPSQTTKTKKINIKQFLIITFLTASLLLASWHNYLLNLQNTLELSLSNLVYFNAESMILACGAPRFGFLGKAAAGLFIRENGHPDELVITNFGGSMELYYAGLPHTVPQLSDIQDQLSDQELMKSLGIHFLVVDDPEILNFTKSNRPAATVWINDKPTLFIYDLWIGSTQTVQLDAYIARNAFYKGYATWQKIRPFSAVVTQ